MLIILEHKEAVDDLSTASCHPYLRPVVEPQGNSVTVGQIPAYLSVAEPWAALRFFQLALCQLLPLGMAHYFAWDGSFFSSRCELCFGGGLCARRASDHSAVIRRLSVSLPGFGTRCQAISPNVRRAPQPYLHFTVGV